MINTIVMLFLAITIGCLMCAGDVYANTEVLKPILNASELKVEMAEIHFDYNSDSLSQKSRDVLDAHIRIMNNDPEITVRIEGHCDEQGSDEYNLELGERRARAAMRYMVTMGIPEKRLTVTSYGSKKPLATGHDESVWALNRRDEFVITSK